MRSLGAVDGARGRWAGRAGMAGLTLAVSLGVAAYASSSSSGASRQLGAGASGGAHVVYIESNVSNKVARNANSVLAFRYRGAGDLHPLLIHEYPTGGAGAQDLTDSGVLDADQHLWMDTPKRLLFAVNQGSDTVAVFHVHQDGSLSRVAGSPFPSGGKAPASVGVSGDTVIVANKAQDGVRNLSKVHPTYATFHIESDGALKQFGRVIRAPRGNSPTDAFVAPNGKFVMSTEEGGPFRAFILGSHGLRQGANSPLEPRSSIFPASLPANERWGLGIAASPRGHFVYIGMATVNKIAVYRYNRAGRLGFISVTPPLPGAMLPCWTLVNRAGTRLYTANAGNNSMSVLNLRHPRHPEFMQTLHLHGNGNPWDIRFDPTGKMIFLIDPRARMNVPPGEGQGLHTLLIKRNGTLREPSYSPVPVPARHNVNPYGMAVLGGT